MFRRMLEWNRGKKQWKHDHDMSWGRVQRPDHSGLTIFQVELEEIIESVLGKHNLQLTEREFRGESETYVYATVRELSLKLWIYEFESEFTSPGQDTKLEWWDTKTPEEHYDLVVHYLNDLIESRDGAA